ncbi:CHAT domain-containing protein [Peziza echinospora]|nr:CHAT domain-containing protein [Peziza echinospora]
MAEIHNPNLDPFSALVYSSHPSLLQVASRSDLRPLESSEISTLQAAILHSRLLNFKKANELFDLLPATNLTVSLEYGSSLFAQGAYSAAESVLSGVKTNPESNDLPHVRAINLLLATVKCFTQANFSAAWDQLKISNNWLKNIPKHEFTDLHLACVCHYYQILMMAKGIATQFPENKFGDLLLFTPPNDGKFIWKDGIGVLRESLQEQGKLMQAYQLLRKELVFVSQKSQPIESFLAACAGISSVTKGEREVRSKEPIWWLEGSAMLLLADYLDHTTTEGFQRTNDLIEAAEAKFSKMHSQGFDFSQLQLKVQYSRMLLNNSPKGQPKSAVSFHQWMSLSQLFEENDNFYHACQCLKIAVTVCDELSKGSGQSEKTEWEDTLLTTTSKMQALQTEKMGDLYLLFADYITTVAFRAITLNTGLSDVYEWIREFEETHGFGKGKYEFWQLRMSKFRWMYQYAMMIGNTEMLAGIMTETMTILEEEKAFWADETINDDGLIQVPVPIAAANLKIEEESDIGEDESDWLIKSTSKAFHIQVDAHSSMLAAGIGGSVTSPVWTYILRWMRNDRSSGTLSVDMLKTMLNFECPATETVQYKDVDLLLSSMDQFVLQRIVLVRDGNPIQTDLWVKAFEVFQSWLIPENSNSRVPISKKHWTLFSLASERRLIAPFEDVPMVMQANQAILDLCPRLCPAIKESFGHTVVPFCRDIIASLTVQAALSPTLNPVQSATLFGAAEDMYELAINEFLGRGRIDSAARVYQNLSMLFQMIKRKGITLTGLDLTAKGLEHLEEAEKLLRYIRRGAAVMEGWAGIDGFVAQKRLVEKKESTIYNVYDAACQHLWTTQLDGTTDQIRNRDLKLWEWIQKGKATVLVEFMGIGGIMSSRLRQSVKNNVKASELFEEEKEIEERILYARPIDLPGLRKRQAEIMRELQELNECKKYLEAREGAPFNFRDSKLILDASKSTTDDDAEIFFIDWYIEPEPRKVPWSKVPDRPITMTVLKAGSEVPVAWQLDISGPVVSEWAVEQLNVPDLQRLDSTHELRRLDALVEPLSKITKPGDLLMFCPTKILHRIPLHALKLNGEVIIRRNPVVYTQSLSLLRYTFLSQNGHIPVEHHSGSGGVLVFGDPPTAAGRSAISQTANSFNTTAHVGIESAKNRFVASFNDSETIPRLVHFHGHCWFSEESPFDHCLQFAHEEYLTAGEVFDIRASAEISSDHAFHITMIACGSGLSEVSVSDNVLGLVPAWLYSGASSTVSTLWPIDDADGAFFSNEFYKSWHEDRVGNGGVVNLAKAVQKAVVAMLDRYNAGVGTGGGRERDGMPVYHWGGFVLHGCWVRE